MSSGYPDFDGEVEEHWREAGGSVVLDSHGDEVGKVEEIYVWEQAGTVHLLHVSGEARGVLVPVHAVTSADEAEIKVEQSRRRIEGAPEFDPSDVPDDETRRGAFQHFVYADPPGLGG